MPDRKYPKILEKFIPAALTGLVILLVGLIITAAYILFLTK